MFWTHWAVASWTLRTFYWIRAFNWIWAYFTDLTSDRIWAFLLIWTPFWRIWTFNTILAFDRSWTFHTFITLDCVWASRAVFNVTTLDLTSFTSFLLSSFLKSNHRFIHLPNARVYNRGTLINNRFRTICDLSWDSRTIRIFESVCEIELHTKHKKHKNKSHCCLFLLLLSRFISVLLHLKVFLQLSNLLVLVI